MCGRFFLETSIEDLEGYYNLSNKVNYKVGEVFPSDTSLIVDNTGFKALPWGFLGKDKLLINGRCETIFERPMFKGSMESRRCLIPANKFYEWKDRKKYSIGVEDTPIFSLGGIVKRFLLKDGSVQDRYIILTTEANDTMKELHHRMPLIIDRTLEGEFLNPKASRDDLKAMLTPYKKRGLSIVSLEKVQQISFL
jgi:putative SOS response-associated peptidase YedK